ncbi:MAG TPA: hypothetical protein VMA32_15125 [Streptosporangiaceae bacterium]|nr:hypothetical protein [Streptosporangiaceae bacterium]
MSRPVGCLVWLAVLILVLIVAALMFGGFQKGTKVSGQPMLSAYLVPGPSLGLCPHPMTPPGATA